MLTVVIVTVVTVGLAGLVMAYVAFPHQGKEIPRAEWLSDAMTRTAERVKDAGRLDRQDRREPTGLDIARGRGRSDQHG